MESVAGVLPRWRSKKGLEMDTKQHRVRHPVKMEERGPTDLADVQYGMNRPIARGRPLI